ncbi:MAG: asparagine synthase (glutamine-hydrolyzing) [Acidobacteriota bacterium]
MCGIVGEIGPQSCSEEVLKRMMGMLTHRGPDESGLLVAPGVAMGHVRLSIVDLASGQQPLCSEDGRHWIVFNGEIFNHVELREELVGLGHVFKTRSDTEVLVNSYRQWGPACLHRLNGQWAFCIWDRDENLFFLARDRWGIRPLFYTFLPGSGTLAFASELKAILADDRIQRSWDLRSLRDIFTCWVCEAGKTPLQSIDQLLPGHYMIIQGGRADIRRWWEIDYSPDLVEWDRPIEEWCERVRAALKLACTLRLRADVAVGAYLSGGLDSSIIALLTNQVSSKPLRTFSLTFADAEYDESEFQHMMADFLGTDHSSLRVTRDLIAESFQKVVWHTETPIYRTAPAPLWHLARTVRDAGLKVVLTGEGADEVFGGYDQFKEAKIRHFWARSPGSVWRKRLLERVSQSTPQAGLRGRAFWFGFYEQGLKEIERPGYSHHLRWKNGQSLLPLLSEAGREGVSRHSLRPVDSQDWTTEVERTVPDGFDRWNFLSKAQYWEIRQLLAGYLLSSQGDRMSMAHGIEGRYPFLDINLFELSRRMPPDLKLRALVEKFILRRTFTRDLPAGITSRRKNAYRAPDALALYHSPLRQRVLESLSPEGVRRRGLFSVESVGKLLTRIRGQAQTTSRDNMALVLTYSAHLFHDHFVEGKMVPSALPPLQTRVILGAGPRSQAERSLAQLRN